MNRHLPPLLRAWLLPLLAFTLLVAGCAVPGTGDLRRARAEADLILARWVEVTGGAARIQSVQCVTTDIAVRFAPNLPEIPLRTIETTKGRFRWELTTPAFGPFVTVSDGLTALRWNDRLGTGLVPAAEQVGYRREADPAFQLKIAEHFPLRIRLPDTVVDGTTLQVIDLRDSRQHRELWFFDPATGLRVRKVEAGTVTIFSDFRATQGITMPFAAETRPGGITYRVTNVLLGETPDPRLFELDPDKVAEATIIEGIITRYRTASGGDALDNVFSRRSTCITEIPAQNLKIRTITTQKRPMMILSEQNIPGMGRFFQGYDGKTAWASSELQGYRELQGAELQQLLNSADLGAESRLGALSPFRRLAGNRELESGPAIGLALASYGGPSGTYWFDNATGRIVRIESSVITGPDSHFEMSMTLDDFRKVDGVWIPFVTRVENPTLKMSTTIQTVENNVVVDDAMFAPRRDD